MQFAVIFRVLALGLQISVTISDMDRCDVEGDGWRFGCIPQGQATQVECENRGCCWKPVTKQTPASASSVAVPVCYFPLNYTTYIVTNTQKVPGRDQMNATLTFDSPYPRNIQKLVIDFVYMTRTTLRIRILDADNARWEPPSPLQHRNVPKISASSMSSSSANTEYDYTVRIPKMDKPFGFSVLRNSGEILLETAGGFIYSDQFLQLSTLLPSSMLYGLGEHRQKLMVSMNWTRLTMWNHDHIPQPKM